jgi:hypothetical protein
MNEDFVFLSPLLCFLAALETEALEPENVFVFLQKYLCFVFS